MRNPITSAWRALRRVAHPVHMLQLVAVLPALVGAYLWLPLPAALGVTSAAVLLVANVWQRNIHAT